MSIVSVQFQNKQNPEIFSGREYSYFTAIPLKAGDVVAVPTKNGEGKAKVVKIGIKESELSCDLNILKTIKALADTELPVEEDKGGISNEHQ